MAREIIVTATARVANGDHNLRAVFWLAVPASLQTQYANPNAASSIPLASTGLSWGVTPAEQLALQNGTVTEQTFEAQVPAAATPAQVATGLVARYTADANALAAQVPAKSYVGASWDGTSWSNLPA